MPAATIYVCRSDECGNGGLAEELRSALGEKGYRADIVEHFCLGFCEQRRRVEVYTPDGGLYAYCADGAEIGDINLRPIGRDPVKTIIEDIL